MRTAPAPPSPFFSAASATWLIACHPARVAELVCIELFERQRRQCRVGLVGDEYGIARGVGAAFRFHDGLLGGRDGSNQSAALKVSAASVQASTSASPEPWKRKESPARSTTSRSPFSSVIQTTPVCTETVVPAASRMGTNAPCASCTPGTGQAHSTPRATSP